MDQELIAYLDERFRETSRQIEGVREENTQQLAAFREETLRRLASLRSEMMQRLEPLCDNVRHTRIEVEGLPHEINEVSETVGVVHERLGIFWREVNERLDEVREAARVPLDIRTRVRDLESWAAKAGLDPIENCRQLSERYRSRPPSCVTGSEPQSVTGDG
jgi:DNA repair ATPase RecN